MEYILNADAFLVATISGRPYFDNLIVTADNTVTLKVLEGCSSFTNLSLAFLGWVAARSYFGTTGVARSLIFVTISCASIVLINTVRIGLIALYPGQYELIHGNVGAAIVGVLVSISIAAISITGARR